MNGHQTWSMPWQARLKHLAENLGPGTPGTPSSATPAAGAPSGAVAVAGTPRKGLRSRGAAMGVTGSWLGRARMRGAGARFVSR